MFDTYLYIIWYTILPVKILIISYKISFALYNNYLLRRFSTSWTSAMGSSLSEKRRAWNFLSWKSYSITIIRLLKWSGYQGERHIKERIQFSIPLFFHKRAEIWHKFLHSLVVLGNREGLPNGKKKFNKKNKPF